MQKFRTDKLAMYAFFGKSDKYLCLYYMCILPFWQIFNLIWKNARLFHFLAASPLRIRLDSFYRQVDSSDSDNFSNCCSSCEPK